MEGATCSSCALDGSRESVKCQVRQEACVTVFLVGTINFKDYDRTSTRLLLIF